MASNDVYSMITDRILAELETGVIPWERPWIGREDGAFSGTTGRPYSLLNQMLLRKPGAWFTWSEIQKRGGKVKKGEKASFVVFWKQAPLFEVDEGTGEVIDMQVPVLRYCNVFHVDQVEGLKLDKPPAPSAVRDHFGAMAIIGLYHARNVPLTLKYDCQCERAYYDPVSDQIVVPTENRFSGHAEFYRTVFHELIHSTGHSSRLNRLNPSALYHYGKYSREELVAELGAAALCNIAGVETKKASRNSAEYIQGWLEVLRNDKRMIVQASGKAAKAVDFILYRPAPAYR